MNIIAIINKQAHGADQVKLEDIDAAAADFELKCISTFSDPDEIQSALQQAVVQKPDVVLIGGGDGTIRAAAQMLANTDIPLAIFPIGTYNHFAATLNLPSKIQEIFKLIHNRQMRRVDIAEVNSVVFMNNASIGLYANILKQREKYIDIFSKSKLWKTAINVFNVFRRFPVYKVATEIKGEKTYYSSCLIFVGNNYYDPFKMGQREELDAGKLCVYVLKSKTKLGILKMLFVMLFKKSSLDNYLDLHTTPALSITSSVKQIDVALDGELKVLSPPLEFKIRKQALHVFSGEM